jgi:hypothetical protein
MRTTLPIFLSLLLLASCKGYVNTGDAVYYKSWNEGGGSQKQYLSADPRTFRDLGHGYEKDISAVYFEGARIYTADASSFEPVSEYFAHDRYSAYQGAARIHGARGTGFHNIDPYNYSTDGHDIYFDTFALHVSDVARFRMLRSDETEHWPLTDSITITTTAGSLRMITRTWFALPTAAALPKTGAMCISSTTCSMTTSMANGSWTLSTLLPSRLPASYPATTNGAASIPTMAEKNVLINCSQQ